MECILSWKHWERDIWENSITINRNHFLKTLDFPSNRRPRYSHSIHNVTMIEWADVGISLHKLEKLLHESTPTMNIDRNQASDMMVLGYREDPGFIPLASHQQKTHRVGPFGNNLRTSCSLT